MASVNFVRDSLVGLPSVPRDDEYEDLKRRRLQEAAKRVEEEKRTARLAKLKYEQVGIEEEWHFEFVKDPEISNPSSYWIPSSAKFMMILANVIRDILRTRPHQACVSNVIFFERCQTRPGEFG